MLYTSKSPNQNLVSSTRQDMDSGRRRAVSQWPPARVIAMVMEPSVFLIQFIITTEFAKRSWFNLNLWTVNCELWTWSLFPESLSAAHQATTKVALWFLTCHKNKLAGNYIEIRNGEVEMLQQSWLKEYAAEFNWFARHTLTKSRDSGTWCNDLHCI